MTRRLLLSYLAVSIIVLVVLEVPFAAFVAERQRSELVTSLERDALVLATIYEDALDRNAPYSPRPALDYAASSDTRVVVVDVDGVSIVDSGNDPNLDFSNRGEIERALEGEITSGRRRSETLGRDLLYVAVPVASGGVVYGAVRITADPADVEATIHRFWWTLGGIAMVVLAAMALVGLVVARSATRPISELREAAIRAGEGDLDVQIDPGDAPPELRELAEKFNEMAIRLRDLIERQRTFVGDASHQLRTPLTALRLRLENLEEGVSPEAREEVSAALVEVERLGRLVNQLLMLARADEPAPELVAVDLAEAIEDRVELWSAVAEESGLEIVGDAPADGVWATMLPGAIEQILDNLLENAVAASPVGSRIDVEVDAGLDTHAVRVIDQGVGMDDGEIEHAFDRFWRRDTTRPGTGLGLAIVRQLTEASGGSISMERASSGGIEVTLVLPAAPSAR